MKAATPMKKFTLEILYTLAGIGSSSGLYFDSGHLFLVSDNAPVLYKYIEKEHSVATISLYSSAVSENIPKKEKPDLEALAFHEGALYAFGSGSTYNRNRLFCVDAKTQTVEAGDLTVLYQKMRAISGIDVHNFNIEGAFFGKGSWYFFQRGNGISSKNGFFKVDGIWSKSAAVLFHECELPDIKKFGSGFTDAVLVGEDCYFLASAEDSASTYEDGAVAGSAIGKLDLQTGKIMDFIVISDSHKFEGITLYASNSGSVSFLLCEDNDSDVLQTQIYKLDLSL